MDERFEKLQQWLGSICQEKILTVQTLPGDASFRRYFRIITKAQTYIAVDSPPEKESCQAFIKVAQCFAQQGLLVPTIFAADVDRGYLLITDFGDEVLLSKLNANNVEQWYKMAMQAILSIQSMPRDDASMFPQFEKQTLMWELQSFKQWFLQEHLALSFNDQQIDILTNSFAFLLKNAEQQTQTCVHRDFHSRNLMIVDERHLAILDFQDAVYGPITYDLVSLLKDCYIDWPYAQVRAWALEYHHLAIEQSIIKNVGQEQFLRWFDLMGVQRHLKAIFIFARKYRRDANVNYLQYIPRTLRYVLEVSARYVELHALHALLEKKVVSSLSEVMVS